SHANSAAQVPTTNTQQKSDPQVAFFSLWRRSADILQQESGSHRLDGSRQTALVTSGLVLVDDVLVSDGVDRAHRGAKDRLSRRLVATHDGLTHGLDRGTQAGTKAGVVTAGLGRLTGALASLCRVGHKFEFRIGGSRKVRDYMNPTEGMQACFLSSARVAARLHAYRHAGRRL